MARLDEKFRQQCGYRRRMMNRRRDIVGVPGDLRATLRSPQERVKVSLGIGKSATLSRNLYVRCPHLSYPRPLTIRFVDDYMLFANSREDAQAELVFLSTSLDTPSLPAVQSMSFTASFFLV